MNATDNEAARAAAQAAVTERVPGASSDAPGSLRAASAEGGKILTVAGSATDPAGVAHPYVAEVPLTDGGGRPKRPNRRRQLTRAAPRSRVPAAGTRRAAPARRPGSGTVSPCPRPRSRTGIPGCAASGPSRPSGFFSTSCRSRGPRATLGPWRESSGSSSSRRSSSAGSLRGRSGTSARRRATARHRAQSLIVLLYLVVAVFALSYYVLERNVPGQLDELSTRTDALYFTVATLATVGYGDVHAAGQAARALVVIQQFFNPVFVGVLVTLLRQRVRARRSLAR